MRNRFARPITLTLSVFCLLLGLPAWGQDARVETAPAVELAEEGNGDVVTDLSSQPHDAPAATEPAASPSAGSAAQAKAAAVPDEYRDLPIGITDEGHPYVGDPDTPVTLEEYSDFLCPLCRRYFQQTYPQILEQYVRTGKVQYVFRDFPLASLHPTAPQGSAAALCVAEQGAGLFWAMHDELFRRQAEWSRLPNPGQFLAGVAEEIGADRAVLEDCLASGRTQKVIEQNLEQAQALRFNGTPSFRFTGADGEDYTVVGARPLAAFARIADPLIAGEKPPEPPKPPKPELPLWAKPEGLAPDPERPGFTKAGDAYHGDPKAPLVVVEFTDFQCDACRRHGLEAQPQLDRDYVETGKVLWVTKYLPLKEHPRAPVAAAAAECAGDQGRFQEMSRALFESQEAWTDEDADVDAALIGLAGQISLDAERFRTCLQGRKALEQVLQDLYDAQGVVRETPTFVLLKDGKGAVTRGAKSADVFAKLLDSRLKTEDDEAGENDKADD